MSDSLRQCQKSKTAQQKVLEPPDVRSRPRHQQAKQTEGGNPAPTQLWQVILKSPAAAGQEFALQNGQWVRLAKVRPQGALQVVLWKPRARLRRSVSGGSQRGAAHRVVTQYPGRYHGCKGEQNNWRKGHTLTSQAQN